MEIFKNRYDLIKSLPQNMNIAEIGVFKGEFSKFIFENLKPNNLILIDLFEGIMGSGDKDGNNMEFINLDSSFNDLVSFFKDKNVQIIKGYSSSELKKIKDLYLDMVYIDASHEYEDVKQDLFLSFEKVKQNGFICGHDYEAKRFPGVVRAVNEFCEFFNLKINAISQDGLPTYLILK